VPDAPNAARFQSMRPPHLDGWHHATRHDSHAAADHDAQIERLELSYS
jgi:hypothetical protein